MTASFKTWLGRGLFAAALLCAIVLSAIALLHVSHQPRTDDAFLQADLVHLAPQVSGQIVALPVRNNAIVHRGDVLFQIDPQPFRLQVDQARAQVASLEASLATATREVQSQQSAALAARASVKAAGIQRKLAEDTASRLVPLGAHGFVSTQKVEDARASALEARVSQEHAVAEADRAQQAVRDTASISADLEGARASLALAERNLRLTRVLSPCDGRITGLDIAAGEYATVGKPVFTIIDTEHWFATGNLRETDLHNIAIGQSVRVFVLSNPDRPLIGRVESFGWGVTPDEAEGTDGLPKVARSLDWVRIAQRFPVRIMLDRPPADMMRIGATVTLVFGP